MRIYFLAFFLLASFFPASARAGDRYASPSDIPAVLLRNLRSGLFSEQYVYNTLSTLRQQGQDGMSLSAQDVERMEAAEKASASKRQLMDLLRYDTDNDGNLTAEEVRAAAATLYGKTSRQDAARMQSLTDRTVQAVMAHDTNGDGVVSYKEMATPSQEGGSYAGGYGRYGDLRDLIALDPSGDGVLTAAELTQLAQKAFSTVDVNGDGQISREEYLPLESLQRQAQERLLRAREEERRTAEMAHCTFGVPIPPDLVVYGAGGYRGRDSSRVIDDSGHRPGEMDVSVDLPGRTVALILGAYDPTTWNIRATPGTKIHSVVLGGYLNQVAEGLPPGTPVMVNTYSSRKGPCGVFYFTSTQANDLDRIAKAVYGRAPALYVPAGKDGKVQIDAGAASAGDVQGERHGYENPVLSPNGGPPDFSRIMHLRNVQDVIKAVNEGRIRPATRADADAWLDALEEHERKTHALGLPPVPAGKLRSFLPPAVIMFGNSFVVLKDFAIPQGFGGYFIIPKGVPQPTGDRGGSAFYDMNTMTCSGLMATFGWEGVKCTGAER